MEIPKKAIKSKARLIVRKVFGGKRKRRSPTTSINHNSTTKIVRIDKNPHDILSSRLLRRTWSKDTRLSDNSKMKLLVKRYNSKRQSVSVDNIQKGRKCETEKYLLLLADNEKLKKKLKNQNRHLEDLKRQLNSERSVYEGKIEYLSTLSDHSCNVNQKSSSTISVSTQTYNEIEDDYSFDIQNQEIFDIEELRKQLYKQTLVTRCVCSKYIKLKTYKDNLMDKLLKSDNFYKIFISDIMQNFEECRISFALAKNDSLDKGTLEQLLDKCARLAYNNAAMQLELFRLDKELKIIKSPKIIYQEDDLNIIKAVKAKSNEYTLQRRTYGSFIGSQHSKSSGSKKDWTSSIDDTLSSSAISLPQNQISICGSVISVPVTMVNNGKITHKMTPMFEIVTGVTDFKEKQQPVALTLNRNVPNNVEYNAELTAHTENIKDEQSRMSLSDLIAPHK